MRNFLEEAMEQETEEESGETVSFEIGPALGRGLGGPVGQKGLPELPGGPGEKEFDLSFPRAAAAGQGERAVAPTIMRASREISGGRGLDRTARDAAAAELRRREIREEAGRAADREETEWEWGRPVQRKAVPLFAAVGRAERVTSFVQGSRRNGTVALPEQLGDGGGGLTVESVDRAVERDARRYGGEFSMY